MSLRGWLMVALLAAIGCTPMVGRRHVALEDARAGKTTFHRLRAGGRDRSYLLHMPPKPSDAPPLLLVLHGNHANAATVRTEARLEHVTDSLGVVVAYLNGSGRFETINLTWNDGACCAYARDHHVDDRAAVDAVADTLVRAIDVDRERVYLAGLSAGGTVALAIVCAGDTTFAGVVSIAGTMPVQACTPKRRLPVMMMRGATDAELPRDHAENRALGAQPYAHSFPASRAYWASVDGCSDATTVDTTAGAIITRAASCPDGLDAQEVVVLGQGHAWPGGKKAWPLAPKPAHYDASTLILRFFTRRESPSSGSRHRSG